MPGKHVVLPYKWHQCHEPNGCENWVFGTKHRCARCWQKFSMAHGDFFNKAELSFDLQ